MIFRNRFGRNVELRTEWGTSHIIPQPGSGWTTASGLPLTQEEAYGIPAVSSVIRSPAEVIAALPFLVYRRGKVRQRAEDSWQWELFHEQPSDVCDTFQFFYDIALSLEASQNAFIQKAKFGRQVRACYVIDPQRVTVRTDRKTREKVIEVWVDGERRRLDEDTILHIRGWTPSPGGIVGVPYLQAHRNAIGNQAAMLRFEGDFFRNSGQAGLYFTGAANKTQAEDWKAMYNAEHQGVGRQFRPGFFFGNMDVKSVPISMEDALFADAKRLSIEDACRIWRWPKRLLELGGESGPANLDAWTAEFLKFYLLPRLRRIERAFAADPDLFFGQKVFGEFLTAALERADFLTRIRAYKDAIQAGHMTPNETRAPENLPPHPGGDELQFPVVGGGPVAASDNQADRSRNGRAELRELEELLID